MVNIYLTCFTVFADTLKVNWGLFSEITWWSEVDKAEFISNFLLTTNIKSNFLVIPSNQVQ